jgi:hypothetical protein
MKIHACPRFKLRPADNRCVALSNDAKDIDEWMMVSVPGIALAYQVVVELELGCKMFGYSALVEKSFG